MLLLIGKGESSNVIYNSLIKIFPSIVCIQEERPNRWKFVKNRARKLGWITAIGQVIFQLSIPKILKRLSIKRRMEIAQEYSMDSTDIPSQKIINVYNINSIEVVELVIRHRPDVVLLNGTRIISKKLLKCTDAQFVNTHLGITPSYRGVHGGYWALANKEGSDFGATIHIVDAGIDTGGILKQILCTPSSRDNFSTFPMLQLGASLTHLPKIVLAVANNEAKSITIQNSTSKLWYHPTIFQYLYNWIKFGVR